MVLTSLNTVCCYMTAQLLYFHYLLNRECLIPSLLPAVEPEVRVGDDNDVTLLPTGDITIQIEFKVEVVRREDLGCNGMKMTCQ